MSRHVRHRLLPEIGRAGVERLEAHRAAGPTGEPRAAAVMRDYLERSGMRFDPDATPSPGPSYEDVRDLAGSEHLTEAAAFLAGAFAAVEEIKRVVEAGESGSLAGVSLGEDT